MSNNLTNIEQLKSEIFDRNLVAVTTDTKGVIVDISKGFELFTGFSKNELLGIRHHLIRHPDTPTDLYTQLWTTILQGDTWYGEIKNKKKNGIGYWSKICIEPLKNDEKIIGFMGIYTNITEQKELIRQIEIDSLTGIYNRSKLHQALLEKIDLAYYNKNVFTVLFIDLDHFKSINDQYGHLEGDRVLVEFCTLIRETLRATDLFGRWGGEEFIVILDNTDAVTAYPIAEKLRMLTQAYDFGFDNPITLSIGACEYSPTKNITQIIEKADKAMYKAKQQGRNKTILLDFNGE